MTKQKHTLRLIIAVLTGIVVAKILDAITHEILYLCTNFPPPFEPMFDTKPLVISLCFHSFYAVTSAMLTAAIAKDRARKAVLVLGTKEAILWLIGTLLLWKHAAPWFNLTKALLGIPLALLGGWIYSYLCRKSEANSISHV
jgi:hypothetical protein